MGKSLWYDKTVMRGRGIAVRVLIAGLLGALIVPAGAVIFPSSTTSANASVTASTSSSSYVDVPFTCSPSLYQTAAPNQANYPGATDGASPRLFTYDAITNRYSASTKTIPEGDGSTPNAIGYNTLDNFIYGVYLPKAGSTYGTAGTKYIVKIDSTGNYKLAGTFTSTFNAISGDFWKNGSQNRYVIHSAGNFAYLDVTNTGNQAAVPLTITGTTPTTLDVTIVGNTMYGMKGTTLYVVNLNTLVGSTKTVSQTSSPGSTAISSTHSFGSAFSDSGGNLYFFNNTTAQVWMIEATQIGQASPQIRPLGSGTALMEGSTAGVTLPNDGASCPDAGSAYSAIITNPSVSGLTNTSATLSTTVNPIGASTTVKYCFGATSSTSGGALQNCTLTAQPNNADDGSPLTGTSPIALDPLVIPDLPPSTTHYWQTVTTSSWAVTYGSVNSFTTLGPPTVSTAAASNTTATSAVLRGFIDPENNTVSTGFCYGTSPDLEDCSLVDGSPSILTGSSNTSISQTVTGLSPGTTYYFQAAGAYSGQSEEGSVLSFTTQAPPSVTRSAETNVASLGAQLNGVVNPQGSATSVSFCLGMSSDLAGCRVYSANESPLIASNSLFAVSANVGSLQASTTYFYKITATNTNGSTSTSTHSFTTQALPLNVTTQNGGLPPGTVGEAYSTSLVAAGGSQPYSWTVTAGSLPAGLDLSFFTGAITGTPTSAGNYTFTIKVRDNTNDNTLKEFTMAVEGSPTATTNQASSVSDTTATLNGLVNPQNLLTAVGFCYATNPNFSDCTHVAASQSPLAAGTSNVSVDASIQGLAAGTTYYVRTEASNNSGSTLGNSISFTTSAAPTVATGAVSNLSQTGTGATLNAVVNPKSGQTAVSFCYSTSPTLIGCTSIPGTPSTLASSAQPSAVSAHVSGLTANTVYYFYAVASNNVGTTYGSTASFTTPTGTVAAPVITGIGPASIGDLSGASVTITGTGFSTVGAGAQVTIGGVSATVNSRSATQLVVTSPAGTAGATKVVVNNVDGQSTSTSTRLSFTSSAPTSVSGTVDNGQSEVTWTATAFTGPAVSNYAVEYSSDAGDSWTSVTRSASTSTSLTVTGLTNGTSYIFRVAAVNSVGTGTFSSSSAAVIPQTLPGQPTGLSSTAGNGQAILSWVAPVDNGGRGITTYAVEYSSNGGSTWVEFTHANSTSTSLNVTGLTNGTSYIFRVAATNSVGTGSFSTSSDAVIPQTLPGQPTGLSGTAGNDQAILSWVAPTDNGGRSITTYKVEYSSNAGNSWAEFTHPNSTSPSVTVTGLTNGTSYIFRVAAINSVGTGSFSSSSAGVIPQTLPGQPTGLSGSAGDGEVALSWLAPADNGGRSITTYTVEYSSNSGIWWTEFTHPNSTSTSLTVTGLTNGTGYVFRVAAINSVGTGSFSASSADVIPQTPPLEPTLPGQPTGLSGTAGNGKSTLSWLAPTDNGGRSITAYTVEYSSNGGTSWTEFEHADSASTSLTVTGLTNGTSYIFRVAAVNSVGAGSFSSSSAGVIPQTLPGQPTGLSGTDGNGQAILTWEAPVDNGGRGITTYAVEYSSNGGSTWVEFTHANSTSTSLNVTGLTNGTSYIFRVAATNSVGTGSFSTSSDAVIPQTLPGQPTGLSGTAGNDQAILSWVAPTDNGGRSITTYKVEYSSNAGNSWAEFTHPNSTSPSVTVTGLTNGTSYIFRVAAINSVGTGSFSSSSAGVIPQTLPGQPTGLSGSAGDGEVALSWLAPADNGGRSITTYTVEYSSNGGITWTEFLHANSTSTSLTVTGLTNGTSYIFRVAATNSVGMGSFSSHSATVNLLTPLSLSFGSRPVGVVLGEPAGTHSVSAITSPSNTGQTIFASATPLICTVNSSTGALTLFAIGTCRITANNAGTAIYSAASQQSQEIPVTSGSMAGLNPADLEFLTSASILASTRYTLSASSSDTELTLTIPSNALPSGTLVKIYLNKNVSTAAKTITSTNHLLNFVIGWTNTNDGSLPIATSPLVINAVNASIKKGMVGYGILNGVPTPLGTATRDGAITLYLTEDPLLVVAATKPDAPTGVRKSSVVSDSSVVSWTVPDNDGGEPITSYLATASPGGSTCTVSGATATSCTMDNLQNGTRYTVTVQAINEVGSSDPSSGSVTIEDLPPQISGDPRAGDGADGNGGNGGGTSPNSIPAPATSPSPSVDGSEEVIGSAEPTPTSRELAAPVVSSGPSLLMMWVGGVAVLVLVAALVALVVTRAGGRFPKGR